MRSALSHGGLNFDVAIQNKVRCCLTNGMLKYWKWQGWDKGLEEFRLIHEIYRFHSASFSNASEQWLWFEYLKNLQIPWVKSYYFEGWVFLGRHGFVFALGLPVEWSWLSGFISNFLKKIMRAHTMIKISRKKGPYQNFGYHWTLLSSHWWERCC